MAAPMRLHVIGAFLLKLKVGGFKSLIFSPSIQLVRHKALQRRPLNVLTVEEAENLKKRKNKYTTPKNVPTTVTRPTVTTLNSSLSSRNILRKVDVHRHDNPPAKQTHQTTKSNDTRRGSVDDVIQSKASIESIKDKYSVQNRSNSETENHSQAQRTKKLAMVDMLPKNKSYFSRSSLYNPKTPTREMDNIDDNEQYFRLPESVKYEQVLEGNKQFGLVKILSIRSMLLNLYFNCSN